MKKLLIGTMTIFTLLAFAGCSTTNDSDVSSNSTTTSSTTTTGENKVSDKVSNLGEDVSDGMNDAGDVVKDILD